MVISLPAVFQRDVAAAASPVPLLGRAPRRRVCREVILDPALSAAPRNT